MTLCKWHIMFLLLNWNLTMHFNFCICEPLLKYISKTLDYDKILFTFVASLQRNIF